MKLRRVLAVLIMVFVLALSLAGCSKSSGNAANDDPGSKKYVIGASMSTFDDKWQTYLIDAIKAYDDENDDVEVKFSDAKNDSSLQISQLETFIAQDVDAIVMVIVDPETSSSIVKLFKDEDIPVVGVNRAFSDIDKITAYVGSESIDAGILQMEEVARAFENEANVAIMKGILGYEPQVKRTEGNMKIIDQHEGLKVVTEGVGKWDRAAAMQVTENWLQNGEKIDVILANNDEMAIGAIKAIKAEGKLDEIAVAGVDATPDALEYIKNGEMLASVYQDPVGQGRMSIEIAVKAAKGESVENFYNIPFELVTKDNVDEYIAKWK